MSLAATMQGLRTHPGAGKVLRKGRGMVPVGVIGCAKWYATASISLSGAVGMLCGWQLLAVIIERLRGGGVMGARARQESHMDYQPAIF